MFQCYTHCTPPNTHTNNIYVIMIIIYSKFIKRIYHFNGNHTDCMERAVPITFPITIQGKKFIHQLMVLIFVNIQYARFHNLVQQNHTFLSFELKCFRIEIRVLTWMSIHCFDWIQTSKFDLQMKVLSKSNGKQQVTLISNNRHIIMSLKDLIDIVININWLISVQIIPCVKIEWIGNHLIGLHRAEWIFKSSSRLTWEKYWSR